MYLDILLGIMAEDNDVKYGQHLIDTYDPQWVIQKDVYHEVQTGETKPLIEW